MKILIVTQTFPPREGGMQSVMKSLAIKLSKNNQVIVIPDHKVRNFNSSNNVSVEIIAPKLPKIIRAVFKRYKIAKIINPKDIIICDSWKSIASIPKNISNMIVVMAHGQEYLNNNKTLRINEALSRATVLIANSAFTLGLVNQQLNLPKLEKYIIPPTYSLPVDIPIFNKKPNQKVRLLSLARIEARKGLSLVLEALVILKEKRQINNFHWDIAGEGPELNKIKMLSRHFSMESNITFHGWVDEKRKNRLFKKADLFIMPSYQDESSIEGFGIVYAEAASYAIPSIAGVNGGMSDAVKDKHSGWTVDPLKPENLQNTLKDAINHPMELKRRGNLAKKEFIKYFGAEKVFKDFMKIIKLDK